MIAGRRAGLRRLNSSAAAGLVMAGLAGGDDGAANGAAKGLDGHGLNPCLKSLHAAAATRCASVPLASQRAAVRSEVLERQPLVLHALLAAQHLAPAAVGALVDEGLGAAVPEHPAERRRLGGVRLHPVERAMLDDRRPAVRRHLDPEEVGDPPDSPSMSAFRSAKCTSSTFGRCRAFHHERDVLPERPERMPVAVEPVVIILRGSSPAAARSARRPARACRSAPPYQAALAWRGGSTCSTARRARRGHVDVPGLRREHERVDRQVGLQEPPVGLRLDRRQLHLARRHPQVDPGRHLPDVDVRSPPKTSCPTICCVQVVPDFA